MCTVLKFLLKLRITTISYSSEMMFLLNAMIILVISDVARSHEETCYDKFEYVFKVMERLGDHEKKLKLQETKIALQEYKIASLTTLLQDAEAKLQLVGDTYTRWGRSSCPNGSTTVYDGFAAGSHYTSKGGAANYICLTKQPRWNDKTVVNSNTNFIHGAEYETGIGLWSNLFQHDVPCAVCHTPRSSVHMLPGRNDCHLNSTLEYSGYLMSGHVNQESATEFVCVDDEPESVKDSSTADKNGKLFYFVTAKCGSLQCPPYEEGKKVTCAVCSM